MKKVMITTATAFALVLSTGMSVAHPTIGHGAFDGDTLPHPNLEAQFESNRAVNVELPIAGLDGAGQNAVKGDPQAAINKEFEPALVGQCSELPPIGSHHHKYSPCGG